MVPECFDRYDFDYTTNSESGLDDGKSDPSAILETKAMSARPFLSFGRLLGTLGRQKRAEP